MARVAVRLNGRTLCSFKALNNEEVLSKIPNFVENNVPKHLKSKVVPFLKTNRSGNIKCILFVTNKYKGDLSNYRRVVSFKGPLCPVAKEL